MATVVLCPDCGQATDVGIGCKVGRVQIDGIGYPRRPYGATLWGSEDDPCDECNVCYDQYHHPGCPAEVCPVCRKEMAECTHTLDFRPYRIARLAPPPVWYKTRLPIVVGTKHGPAIRVVKARRYGQTCLAIRKLKGYGIPDQPPGEWAVFYVTTGYGLATARTRAEAEQLAIELEPLLTPLSDQIGEAAKAVVQAYYHRCETEA